MFIDELTGYLGENHNVLMYQQGIYELFSDNRGEHPWAFISNPKKGKTALSDVVKVLDKGRVTKSLSVAQLLDIISDIARESTDESVVLWIDNFDRVNKRTLEYYQDLRDMGNVLLVCNIVGDEEEFIDSSFFDETFVILNSDEYSESRARSINVKFTLLLLLSVFTFLLFVRVQLSHVGYLVSALWFSLLMYRSFYYVTR